MWAWLTRSNSGAGGGAAPTPLPETEHDALSASVDLEDIIDQYDGYGKEVDGAREVGTGKATTRTTTPTHLTSSNSNQTLTEPPSSRSQTFFSLSAADTNAASQHNSAATNQDDSDAETYDETTSFYSAQQDSFAMSTNPTDPDLRYKHVNFFASMKRTNGANASAGMRSENFEVIWSNLSYTIRPKTNMWLVWRELQHKLSPAHLMSSVFGCRRDAAAVIDEEGTGPIQFVSTFSD